MSSVEERVAYLEGRLEDHANTVGGLRGSVDGLREEVNRRLEGLDGRVVTLDQKMGQRFEHLDQKVDRHFTWLVGIQVAVLVAVVGTLVGSYYR